MDKSILGGFEGVSGVPKQPPEKAKYCLYARKSTESDELQALSIDSQIKEMLQLAEREKLDVREIRKESFSAKDSGQRPVFNQIIADIKSGRFSGILTWAPDRLSRNAGDLGALVDLMDQKLLYEIRTHGQRFTNSPNEKFLLMILCSQAKLENDNKGENVKRGLRAKCSMGWRPGVPPIGYLHDKEAEKGQKRILMDPKRSPFIKQIYEKVAYEKWSGRDIYEWLQKIGFRTRGDKRLALSRIFVILKDTFYYGKFEYPIGGGTWYDGGYDPIITKELFDLAQEKMCRSPRRHPGTHEFDFVKLLRCGNCGYGICAEEKFKHQKNGNTHRYVYYHCTGGTDHKCKQPMIREEELVRQLLILIDKIDFDEMETMDKFRKEFQRYQKFSYNVLGQTSETEPRSFNANMKNYATYVLTEGSKDEKRELLSCLTSKLFLKDKIVYLKFEAEVRKNKINKAKS